MLKTSNVEMSEWSRAPTSCPGAGALLDLPGAVMPGWRREEVVWMLPIQSLCKPPRWNGS